MSKEDQQHCRYCGDVIDRPRRGQKFCSDKHRYLWHKGQMISPAKLEERIRTIVKEELDVAINAKVDEITRKVGRHAAEAKPRLCS